MNRYVIDWEAYASLARAAAAEGAVLLKNENGALPLKSGQKLSVFGRIQLSYYKSGTGSGGMVNTRYVVSIPDALKEEELIWNEELEKTYADWVKEHPFDEGQGWAQEPWSQEEMPLEDETVEKAAAFSETALVIIGRTAGEDRDAKNEKGSYLLTDAEEAMLEKVCRAFSKTIVVLNVGSIMDMSWVERYQPDAVLYTWQGGQEGGHAVADVLMGRVNPSGKLTDTIAKSIGDYPSTKNFGGEKGNFYQEDIYVGYRYFETFAKDKVVYPFGYGLSYTTFDISTSSAEYASADGMLTLHVNVKNTGSIAGKESVLVYVKPPQGVLGKPYRNLIAFGKTKELKPGESQELLLTASDARLSSYDDSGLTGKKSCYVMEAGTYVIYVGTDVRSAKEAYSFELPALKVTERCTEALAPVEAFERLRPGRDGEETWEQAPLRTYSMKERMNAEELPEAVYTGDQGYQLSQVYDGEISMEAFLSQIPDEELCNIVRGEGMCSAKVTPGTAAAFGGVTDALKDFGIPCGCCTDGPSGIRMDCGALAFSLPNGTCLACSLNEELSEALYQMEGLELRKNRIDSLLGPGINIHRNPLNGRNFEYFSEDPLVTGLMAAAQLRGMHAYGTTGTIKHFAANNQEFHRHLFNSVVSERALREIYLKGFEIAVKEGDARSIMSTYGAVNGLWTAGNYDLLTTILRGEWGYTGMVMTDWWAMMNDEGEEPSKANLAAMVRAQNDIYMVISDMGQGLPEDNLMSSLADGTLKRASLQRCAANVLTMLLRSPVMDRFLDRQSEEEKEAIAAMDAEDQADFDLTYYPIPEEGLELLDLISETKKGSSYAFGVERNVPGFYSLHVEARVNASELAQVALSVFSNGKLAGTLTLNGTNKEYVSWDVSLGMYMWQNSVLKLYFAESGMELKTACVKLEKSLAELQES